MILRREHYELIAKYSSEKRDSLQKQSEILEVLNILGIESADAVSRSSIANDIKEQNTVLTEIISDIVVLQDSGENLKAYKNFIDNIYKIKSIYMLDAALNVLVTRQI